MVLQRLRVFMVGISFAVLLGASLDARGPIRAVLTLPLLMFLGRRCYRLYLWHVLIAGFVTAWLHSLQVGFIAHVLLWFGALVIVASGSWLLIEEPILRLKRFFPYVQRQPVQLEPHRVTSTAAWWPPVVGPNGLPEPQAHVFQNKGADRRMSTH